MEISFNTDNSRSISPARLKLLKDLEYDSNKKRDSLSRNETKRISSKLNKILIENTPTPLINQKYSNKVKHLQTVNDSNKLGESKKKSLAKTKIIMVPNTPLFNQFNNKSTQSFRKVKKLFNVDDNLNEDDMDLPGDDLINLANINELNPLSKRITTAEAVKASKKVSSLFKPKSCQDEEDNFGSDLSFETLQKRQRRHRNVVRRSEIYPTENEKKLNKKTIETKNLDEISSSPIIVQSMPGFEKKTSYKNHINDLLEEHSADAFENNETKTEDDVENNLNSTQTDPNNLISPNEYFITPIKINTPNCKSSATSLFISKTNYEHDYSTFTKVTRQIDTIFGLDTETRLNEDQSSDYSENETKNASKILEIKKSADDFDRKEPTTPVKDLLSDTQLVDLILFDGLTINSVKKAENKIFTGIHDKINRNAAHSKVRKNPFGLVDKTNTFSKVPKSKSEKNIYNKKNKYLVHDENIKQDRPKITKYINIAHFGLSLDQISKAKTMIKSVNQICSTTIAKLCGKYSPLMTHLVIDFKTSFETSDSLSLNKKCLLIIAALNNCKIVRYEWLKHSQVYNTWLDEADYLIESYVEEDLSEYDQGEFDIKLIKFIRSLKNGKSSKDTFALHKNVYVMEQNEFNESSLSESKYDYEKLESSNSCFLYKENSTYNYITDLLIKCGANLTSRVGLAEMIITIDNEQMDRTEMQDCFERCLVEFKKSIRKKCGVKVISSDWIIDTLINNWDPNTSLSNYEIASVYPEK